MLITFQVDIHRVFQYVMTSVSRWMKTRLVVQNLNRTGQNDDSNT